MSLRSIRLPALVLGVALAATACGGDDTATGGGEGPLAGATITVGSKDFDEQLILGHISKIALENAGAKVIDQINLGGTDAARAALVSNEIDHYWEYKGTAWISFFGETEPIPDRIEQYEAVRHRDAEENDLVWLEPAPFNNTYGIAYRTEAASQLGNPETISDLGELASTQPQAATLCVENRFSTRDDGLPGLEKTYGFEIRDKNVTVLDTGIVYTSTDKGDPCNFGEVFTTDGRIGALELTVLEDDKSFFPLYNASPVFTQEVFSEHGEELVEIFDPITDALTQEEMTSLNKLVSADGLRPEMVAEQWLQENNLLD
jgi:osmoprotectant transport system substrate-binding protein